MEAKAFCVFTRTIMRATLILICGRFAAAYYQLAQWPTELLFDKQSAGCIFSTYQAHWISSFCQTNIIEVLSFE
jgi:diphthamide synthase (EF-2-diphthine--ammonia ligase)